MKTVWIFVIGCWLPAVATGTEPIEEQIRATVSLSLPFIRAEGEAWIQDKDCLSCHQIPFMVWSLNTAASLNFETDRRQLDTWNRWSLDWTNLASPETRDDAVKIETLKSSNDSVAQLLIGLKTHQTDITWHEAYVNSLLKSQQPSGLWKAGGQLPLQKRPKWETQEVSSMWSMVALATHFTKDNQRFTEATTRFESSLKADKEPQSTEWWAMRLLVADKLQQDQVADRAVQTLIRRQHDNGSWGWLMNEPGDALGTSIAVYALAHHGMNRNAPALSKAIDFLIRTQKDDGSWDVNSTKSGSRDSVTDTATYWGTTWAVIALCEVL